MIWEPLNCCSFLEKVYLRLHKNVLGIFFKYFTRECQHLRPEVQAILHQLTINMHSYIIFVK